MSPSLTTFFFELVNFLALAVVLTWLFFKPVRKALEDQHARARAQEEAAARKLAEAEQLRTEMESQRQSLASELETMQAEARELARKERETLLADAHQRLEQERAVQRRQALNLEKTQMARIAQAVARTTHAVVERFLGQMQGQDLERTLLQAACRELPAFSGKHHGSGSLAPVTIESASPLDAQARQMIESALGPAKDTANYQVNPALIAGLRIATAQGLVDASVAGLAEFAGRSLQAEMEAMVREESSGD
jgi:F-type H+-transporting ATPase subunit b